MENKVGILAKQPLVSIITPTYNHERYMEQCIESVLAQTYPNWEQIIIDDGSTDKTQEKVLRYKDERIHYIRQDNVGIWRLGATYNKALKRSRGEFIAILEGDDYWPPYKLERQLPAFANPEVVLSWGRGVTTNETRKTLWVAPKNLKKYQNQTRQETLKMLFLNKMPVKTPTVMCRKDALLSIGGFKQPEYLPLVDYPTYLELCLTGEFFAVDEILGCWRWHKDSVSVTMNLVILDGCPRYAMDFLSQLPQELRDSVNVDINRLTALQQQTVAKGYFSLGRANLIDRSWEDARKNLALAIRKGSFLIRLKALLGLFSSYLKIDLEWLTKVLRRPRLE